MNKKQLNEMYNNAGMMLLMSIHSYLPEYQKTFQPFHLIQDFDFRVTKASIAAEKLYMEWLVAFRKTDAYKKWLIRTKGLSLDTKIEVDDFGAVCIYEKNDYLIDNSSSPIWTTTGTIPYPNLNQGSNISTKTRTATSHTSATVNTPPNMYIISQTITAWPLFTHIQRFTKMVKRMKKNGYVGIKEIEFTQPFYYIKEDKLEEIKKYALMELV